jgi:hypothetical protein
LIAAQKEAGALSRGGGEKGVGRKGKNAGSSGTRIPLSESGIDKKLADRGRKLARLTDEKFETVLSEGHARVSHEGERVQSNLIREGARASEAGHGETRSERRLRQERSTSCVSGGSPVLSRF